MSGYLFLTIFIMKTCVLCLTYSLLYTSICILIHNINFLVDLNLNFTTLSTVVNSDCNEKHVSKVFLS